MTAAQLPAYFQSPASFARMCALPLRRLAPSAPPATSAGSASLSAPRARQPFADFIEQYRERLSHLFAERASCDAINADRGVPPFVLDRMREVDPLSVYIAEAHGGRGGHIREGLAVLEETGYHSLALTLLVGINGGLFLQPVGKYGSETVQARSFAGILRDKRLGGLMITEPGYGSDALSMKTSWRATGRGTARIEGTKHWGGLTGWADYWLVTARPLAGDGNLRRDVDFFVADQNAPGETIAVEEIYPNLGLRMLPYGRNRVDIEVPESSRLEPETTGVKMMLDILHRSRLQFPGMGIGYLRRMLDEAVGHCRERFVGGQSLLDYDQVRARIAKLQAAVTNCAALCLDTSENAGMDRDLSGESLKANAFKTTVSDWMQEASQSLLQLVGGNGYRADHIAGRSTVDSRPFQIFEGSNDILYQQVTESVLKSMRRVKETHLGRYLASEPLTARAATLLGDALAFELDWKMPQRKLVDLGRAISRIISMEMTIELGERGFAADLIANALDDTRTEVRSIVEGYRTGRLITLLEDAAPPDWLARTRPAL
jgi:alkylation response protein AidB-like acyl-CoA dehydrogenase